MSVLCVRIPGFLLQLACREDPQLPQRPAALLDGQGVICAINRLARAGGVALQMRPPQALACCPELLLSIAKEEAAQAAQQELLAQVAELGVPVEEHGWGCAYLDLHGAAHTPAHAEETAAWLGRRLRAQLGEAMAPALGWDSSKFTARAAASYTVPGRIKLVGKTEERRFLSPLPTRLLPLSPLSVQELAWLGIHTLGQFSQLPVTAVVQRYGAIGRTAHQWARGLDDRPVCATSVLPSASLCCTFAPAATLLAPVVDQFRVIFQPQLDSARQQLCGVRRILLTLTFLQGEQRALTLLFVEPVGEMARILQHLSARLQALVWPQALETLEIRGVELGELIVEQRSLFEQPGQPAATMPELAQRLARRYGALFWQGVVDDPAHPLAERRFCFEMVGRLEHE